MGDSSSLFPTILIKIIIFIMTKKIYCKNCKWCKYHKYNFDAYENNFQCTHIKNRDYDDDYAYSLVYVCPQIDMVNEDNDCKLFEKKPWWKLW